MGKRRVHRIVVRKPVSVVLLVLTTAAMLAVLYALAETAHVRETRSTRDLLVLLSDVSDASADRLIALLTPAVLHAMVFVPWGFLTFVVIDRPERPRAMTYLSTVAAAIGFVLAVEWWQSFLPSRVVSPSDVIAHAAGATTGAVLGHLRKQVRVEFEV